MDYPLVGEGKRFERLEKRLLIAKIVNWKDWEKDWGIWFEVARLDVEILHGDTWRIARRFTEFIFFAILLAQTLKPNRSIISNLHNY